MGPVDRLRLDDWRHGRVAGLELYTNARTSRAREVTREIETYLAIVRGLVRPNVAAGDRPAGVVFLFANASEYAAFSRAGVAAHMVPGDDRHSLWLSAQDYGLLGFDSRSILQHELVHLVLFSDSGRVYPPWFNEGLAEFFGTAILRENVATVGGVSRPRLQTIRANDPLPLERLLGAGRASAGADTPRIYADGWAFTHYGLLSSGLGGPPRTRELLAFVRSVADGADWRSAFEASFSGTLEEIEEEYLRHRTRLVESKVHPEVHVEVELRADELTLAPVPRERIAAELGAAVLDAGLGLGSVPASWLFDVALEDADASEEVLSNAVRAAAGGGRVDEAERAWRRLLAAGADPRAHRLARADLAFARYREDDEDRAALAAARADYRAVLEARPRSTAAARGLAATFLEGPESDDPAPAIAALEPLVQRYSWVASLRVDLARLLLAAGRPEEASSRLRAVVEEFPGSREAKEATELLDESGAG